LDHPDLTSEQQAAVRVRKARKASDQSKQDKPAQTREISLGEIQ